jgi:hypothetical protein
MDSKSQDERDKESYERQRVTRACKICQKLHIKCDGKFPCTQCVGKGKSCSYANSATEALLEDRVKSLEVTVKEGTKKNIELEQDNMRLQAEIEQSHQATVNSLVPNASEKESPAHMPTAQVS